MNKPQNNPIISWNDGVLTSNIYGDIYFSKESGLEETIHVFLNGNNLPERWKTQNNDFHIIETGFGTGLNFFAAWKLWDKNNNGAKLYYTSIEKHPLPIADIKQAISTWPEFDKYFDQFKDNYPTLHKLDSKVTFSSNNIELNLLIGDINITLPTISKKADAWFLDGFSPALNPDMWGDNLYKNMQNLTKKDGTFATFTSSGKVRRGLLENGFIANKTAGYGKKRHILTGTKNP